MMKNEYYKVEKFDKEKKYSGEVYIYVKIYENPISELKMFWLPKFLWFENEMQEKIAIKYWEDGEVKLQEYKFDLKWTRREHWIT